MVDILRSNHNLIESFVVKEQSWNIISFDWDLWKKNELFEIDDKNDMCNKTSVFK